MPGDSAADWPYLFISVQQDAAGVLFSWTVSCPGVFPVEDAMVGKGERGREKGKIGVCDRKRKTPQSMGLGRCGITSLTITYFHTGCSTIIGAESFHGPVRDGKGWYQLAMVIRHNL